MTLKDTNQFSHTDIAIQKQETTYQGYFTVKRFHFNHRLFSGEWSPVITREVLITGNAVGVLPYDPVLNKVVLIQQFRIGAMHSDKSPWLLEIIGGSIDNDNTHEETAFREAKEEAGLDLHSVQLIGEYWTAPAGLSQKMYLFCAHVDASQVEGVYGLSEEGENIKAVAVDAQEAFHAVANREITSADAIIALQWLELNHARISGQWISSPK